MWRQNKFCAVKDRNTKPLTTFFPGLSSLKICLQRLRVGAWPRQAHGAHQAPLVTQVTMGRAQQGTPMPTGVAKDLRPAACGAGRPGDSPKPMRERGFSDGR